MKTKDIYDCFPNSLLRKMSLQSNTMFHLGGFLNPMDGLVKRFTVLFVKDTEFTGLHLNSFYLSAIIMIKCSGERMLDAVNNYRPDNVMAIPSHFQAVSCVVRNRVRSLTET